MKIELTCPHCESVLRVDDIHAGKQLRCPNCQNLTSIPAVSSTPSEEPSTPSEEPTIGQIPSHEKPVEHSPYSQPMEDFAQAPPHYINPTGNFDKGSETNSLVLGIVGIFMNAFCCGGCGAPIWIVLNIVGLSMALKSDGPMRTACIITNVLSLIIGSIRLLLLVAVGIP